MRRKTKFLILGLACIACMNIFSNKIVYAGASSKSDKPAQVAEQSVPSMVYLQLGLVATKEIKYNDNLNFIPWGGDYIQKTLSEVDAAANMCRLLIMLQNKGFVVSEITSKDYKKGDIIPLKQIVDSLGSDLTIENFNGNSDFGDILADSSISMNSSICIIVKSRIEDSPHVVTPPSEEPKVEAVNEVTEEKISTPVSSSKKSPFNPAIPAVASIPILFWLGYLRKRNVTVFDVEDKVIKKLLVKAKPKTVIDLNNLKAETFKVVFKYPNSFRQVDIIIRYRKREIPVKLEDRENFFIVNLKDE